MTIFLKNYNLNNLDFKNTFQPNEKGEVKIEIFKKVYNLKTDEEVEKALANHPDFYVTESTSKNGNTNLEKDSKLSDK